MTVHGGLACLTTAGCVLLTLRKKHTAAGNGALVPNPRTSAAFHGTAARTARYGADPRRPARVTWAELSVFTQAIRMRARGGDQPRAEYARPGCRCQPVPISAPLSRMDPR